LRNWRVLRVVSLATVLAFLAGTPPTALADNVVADDQIVQGNLCVGIPCVNGEPFPAPGIKVKAISPRLTFEDTDQPRSWSISATGGVFGFTILDGALVTLSIAPGAPTSIVVDPEGKVGMGVLNPTQKLHVSGNQNANTFFLLQNPFNGLNAAAVIRTQADTAMQNFQSHATSRTLVRWGVPLGGWNEFLSFVGNGLAMGTFGNAPFILGTSATARMTFDGDSNVIEFAGGGQYNGASFLDASSRTLKQDIRPLAGEAAVTALAGLEPVTFAYTGAPSDARVGFIAEDVPELVATPGRQTLSALEIVAVLTKVVQEQQRVVQDQQKALAELTARLNALEMKP
jgi:endosialidase-like protein